MLDHAEQLKPAMSQHDQDALIIAHMFQPVSFGQVCSVSPYSLLQAENDCL